MAEISVPPDDRPMLVGRSARGDSRVFFSGGNRRRRHWLVRRLVIAVGVAVISVGMLVVASRAIDFVIHHTNDRGVDLVAHRSGAQQSTPPRSHAALSDDSLKSHSGTPWAQLALRARSGGAGAAGTAKALGTIPDRLLTTAPSLWQTPGLRRAMASFAARNARFVSKRFDDAEQRAMVALESDPRTLEAFDALVPTAFKADIWRLVALKRGGGVYHDAKMACYSGRLASITRGVSLVLVADRTSWTNEPRCGPAIYQAFLAAAPAHPFVAFALRDIVARVLRLSHSPRDVERLEQCCLSLTGPHALEHAAASFWHNWTSVSHEYSSDYSLTRRDGTGVDRVRMLVRVDENFERTYRWDEVAAYVAKRERSPGAKSPAVVPLIRTEYAGYADDKRALRYESTASHYSQACKGSSAIVRDESGSHWIATRNPIDASIRAFLKTMGFTLGFSKEGGGSGGRPGGRGRGGG